jgi:hypothetical protein
MRATAQDDREIGPEPLEFARERHARHAGHVGFGDDEVKPSRCRRPPRTPNVSTVYNRVAPA